MPTSRWKLHVPAAVLMALGVACREAPLAPSLSRAGASPLFSMDGNSDAAQACQKDGYQNLFRTDGTSFENVGDCVSYAAQGGTLATRRTATLTNVLFDACNGLTLGYELDGVGHDLETKPEGCFSRVGSDQTIHYLSTQTLRTFLRDESCNGWTFFEDGNHATVTGSNPYEVKFADGGGFCEAGPDVPRPPGGASGDPTRGNLNLTKTIS